MQGMSAGLVAVLIAGVALAACGPQPSGGDSLACNSAVQGIEALHAGLQIPEYLQQEDAVKQGGEFDANRYFDVLTHLALEPDSVLDYVYYFDGMGGGPMLYTRPAGQAPYRTAADYQAAQSGTGSTVWAAYLDDVRADGTAEGFMQFVVLETLGGQFYLYWHSNYNDTRIICDQGALNGLFDDLDRSELKVDASVRRQATRLRLEPSVTLEGDTAVVRLVTFTKWGGFQRTAYTVSKSFPHEIVNKEVESAVPYDCGIVF